MPPCAGNGRAKDTLRSPASIPPTVRHAAHHTISHPRSLSVPGQAQHTELCSMVSVTSSVLRAGGQPSTRDHRCVCAGDGALTGLVSHCGGNKELSQLSIPDTSLHPSFPTATWCTREGQLIKYGRYQRGVPPAPGGDKRGCCTCAGPLTSSWQAGEASSACLQGKSSSAPAIPLLQGHTVSCPSSARLTGCHQVWL